MAHTNKTADGGPPDTDTIMFLPKWNTNSNIELCARSNESIMFFTDLCKPIETYIYARKKAPICMLSRSKAPKRSKLTVADMRQKPVNFFDNNARASTLDLAIIFNI